MEIPVVVEKMRITPSCPAVRTRSPGGTTRTAEIAAGAGRRIASCGIDGSLHVDGECVFQVKAPFIDIRKLALSMVDDDCESGVGGRGGRDMNFGE